MNFSFNGEIGTFEELSVVADGTKRYKIKVKIRMKVSVASLEIVSCGKKRKVTRF